MSAPRFGRVITAMVTPFDERGDVDFDVARDVARFLVAHGSDALVVAGSTGEGSSLDDDEKLNLFACVAEAVSTPVLAGTSFANTRHSVALTARVAACGVAGVLATTPAYARPSQAGIEAHLGAVAEATTLPVMLYDIPSRTGRKIHSATTVALAQKHANVVALKDASGDVPMAAHTKSVLGDQLDLYSGDDAMTLPFIAVGAAGVVSVAAHWAGAEFAALVAAALAGDPVRAGAINEQLRPSIEFESSEVYPNPLPTKAMMRQLGFAVGECRLPHAGGDEVLDARAHDVLTQLRFSRD
ncbi:MAG: 4-hydroxy-tetrahydrodipicolinate synthase [Acidobacteriota bacterium]|nr:4-hydroxy-tetrahydrodipicolinate synthase [Acidobacteriota bacterium]